MSTPTNLSVLPRCGGATLSLDVQHWHWDLAARLVEAIGGNQLPAEFGIAYRFTAESTRDYALDLVRRQLGWTIANHYGREARTDA
jgi:hypothetical protein